jgi:hypothetical protein
VVVRRINTHHHDDEYDYDSSGDHDYRANHHHDPSHYDDRGHHYHRRNHDDYD